jgi:multiple sugar transport system substrate-binding protein
MLAVTALAAVGLIALSGCGTASASSGVVSSGAATTSDTSSKAGRHVNFYCWNKEFQGLFRKYSTMWAKTNDDGTDTLKDGRIVVWKMTDNADGKYQAALDAAITYNDQTTQDAKIDMFLVEADYAMKYTQQAIAMDVKTDVGLTDTDLANQYDYTKKIMTVGNSLKGVSWQATPGLYAYRTDYAQKVFGTSDPTEVQKKISNWTDFDSQAAVAKTKDIHMLAGIADSYRTYSNNVTSKWATVEGTGKEAKLVCHLDDNIKKWIKATKNYADQGYLAGKTADYGLWKSDWAKEQSITGTTLGFFWSTWGINFSLKGYASVSASNKGQEVDSVTSDNLYGKYRVCVGPQSYYWGGTWMMGAKGSDDVDFIKQTMKDFTVDPTIMKQITKDTQDFTNNSVAMEALAKDGSAASDFLGGQNHIALFTEAAKKIDLKYISAYDQYCNEDLQNAMTDYFAGTVDYATAIANFKSTLSAKFKEMTYDTSFDSL